MGTTGTHGYRLTGEQGRLEIDGLKEVLADLRAFGVDTRDDMKDTHRKAGEIVAAVARTIVPVRTGRLAKTIVSAPTQRMGRVRAGRGLSIPYAGPIHFGWPARRIAPQPFIYDALDKRADEVRDTYKRRIDDLIVRHRLAAGQRSTTSPQK